MLQAQDASTVLRLSSYPDGTMYVVDYGVVKIDMSLAVQGKPPYNEVPGTGVIWRIVPDGMQPMQRERIPVRKGM
jgi:hypothetical protein